MQHHMKRILRLPMILLACVILSGKSTLATTQLDLLVVYDTTAKTWVESNGGLTNFAVQAVAKMNLGLTNSNIDAHFNLVHVGETGYTHVDLGTDLTALQAGSNQLAAAHAMRDIYGADLVAMFVDTGSAFGTVGLGYTLGYTNGSPDYPFTVNAIRSIDLSHTLTHEVGHNMGCGHSKNQTPSPGPNNNLNTYSAGWYFRGTNATDYHTIMAYGDDGYGTNYTEAPLFSTPLINWQGTAAGHVADGDNARNIRETMNVVSLYRFPPQTVPFSEDFENAGSMPNGWQQSYIAASVDWSYQNGGHDSKPPAAHGGSYNAFLFFQNYSGYTTRLITPILQFGNQTTNTSLTFWHHMEAWGSDQDELRVYYRSFPTNSWSLLQAYTNNTASWTQRTISLPNPSDTYQIAFEGKIKYGYGICIDDVAITGDAPAEASAIIGVAPSAYNIPSATVGAYTDVVFTVTNAGNASLTGSATVSNSTVRITSGTNYTLNAGETQNVTVRFSPTTAGSHTNIIYFSGAQGTNAIITANASLPEAPQWWSTQSVLQPAATTNDYAALNAGQLKWIATKAKADFDANLPGGAGTNINTLVSGFSTSNNYVTVNIGQVKTVAKPFYDRMQEIDAGIAYPWTATSDDDSSYAAANIGQVKNVFLFGVVDGKPWSGAQTAP